MKKNDDTKIQETIQDVDYESEMAQSYVDYAMSVITSRALPDVRDGLKPVQRRVLYTLNTLTKPDGPHRKCARIVGDAMGKFHPHGDSSIYEGLVNMAQNWKATLPLVDPHGNFGSVDGSGAAAMRYTEARISAYANDVCMKDLDFYKDNFIPNFDETEKEPTVLPFQVPNILINGTSGIAVGMATNIPTHNLGEVIDATILYLKNPNVSLEELLTVMPGPDFATGGIINTTKENLYDIYSSGQGKLKVRGKVEVRELERGRKSICVTELSPKMINATMKYLNTVADLTKSHALSSVVDIADRGDKNGECLCVDVKKGTEKDEIENIINVLYKKTELEDTFGVNMNCINQGKPQVMGLIQILQAVTDFKKELYKEKYRKLLEQQEEIKEIRSGLIDAVDCIDLIIEILRGSNKVGDVKECLIHGNTEKVTFRYKKSEQEAKRLRFTEKQADAILSMKLQKLIGLELDGLQKEMEQADRLITKYKKMLENNNLMVRQMINDLEKIKEQYAVPRKTVIGDFGEVKIRETQEEAMGAAVLLDRFYYVKVIDEAVYDKNKEQIERDYRHSFKCMTTDRIGIFTNTGQMYMVRIQDIIKIQSKKSAQKKERISIFGKLSDKGVQVFDFCNMSGNENILYMGCIEQFKTMDILFVNTLGLVKRVNGEEFDVSRKVITATKNGDMLLYVNPVIKTDFLAAGTDNGYYIKIPVFDIPRKGKGAAGVKLMELSLGDNIKQVVSGSNKACINTRATQVPLDRIKSGKRGGKGTKLRL